MQMHPFNFDEFQFTYHQDISMTPLCEFVTQASLASSNRNWPFWRLGIDWACTFNEGCLWCQHAQSSPHELYPSIQDCMWYVNSCPQRIASAHWVSISVEKWIHWTDHGITFKTPINACPLATYLLVGRHDSLQAEWKWNCTVTWLQLRMYVCRSELGRFGSGSELLLAGNVGASGGVNWSMEWREGGTWR